MKFVVTIILVILLASFASQKLQPQQVTSTPSQTFSHRTVTITDTNPVVFISGEVNHPGALAWYQGMTVSNAIDSAKFGEMRWIVVDRLYWDGTSTRTMRLRVTGPGTNLLEQDDIVNVRARRRLF